MSERREAVIKAVRDAKKRHSLGILSQICGINESELNNIALTGDVALANEIVLGAILENAHGESMVASFPSEWE
jgi:hypothetical protein